MKRILWVLGAFVFVLVVLAISVSSMGSRAEPLPELDPDMLISMPDGSEQSLSALVAAAEAAEPVVESEGAPPSAAPREKPSKEDLLELARKSVEDFHKRPLDPTDLYQLAETRLRDGDVDEALALLRSIPPTDRRYPRAQRRIGWDILTKQQNEPARGIAYVNRCLAADPTDGNAWQDAARVWGNSLGIPVD